MSVSVYIRLTTSLIMMLIYIKNTHYVSIIGLSISGDYIIKSFYPANESDNVTCKENRLRELT